MAPVLTAQELGRLKQAMLLGLARHPLAIPDSLQPVVAASPEPALALLALAGQQQRFQRAGPEPGAVPEAARLLHDDPRPVLPEPARRGLLRLANGLEGGMSSFVLPVAVRRLARAGLRPHPFDLPLLVDAIKSDARCLGLAERAYLLLADATSAADAPGLLHQEITEATWTGFPKAHRVAFLRDMRRKTPTKARLLLEGVFKDEPAALRGDLLGALDVGLGTEDLAFLESLAADRAESVRRIAAGLIARMPGTPAFAARLADAARCFARDRSAVGGVLRRMGLAGPAAVVFTPPPVAKGAQLQAAIATLLDGFSAAEIAAAAGVTSEELIDALGPKDEAAWTMLAERAARDADRDTMMRLVAIAFATGDALAARLAWLASQLDEPASAEFGRALLDSPAFQGALRRLADTRSASAPKDDGTLVWSAALLPPSLLAPFLAAIEPLDAPTTRGARDFAALVRALEKNEGEQRT